MARARVPQPAKVSEPTFEEAQSWWSKMQRPVTFVGVPGHPQQATVLWNTGLLFCSNPREWSEGRLRMGSAWRLAPHLSWEMNGSELDALHIEFSFGKDYHLPDRLDNSTGEVQQELLEGRMPVVINRLVHEGIDWTQTVFSRLVPTPWSVKHPDPDSQYLLTEVQWAAHNPGKRARTAQLSAHLTAPHVTLGYKIRMETKAYPYLRAWHWDTPILFDDRRTMRLAAQVEGDGEVTFTSRFSAEELKSIKTPLRDVGLAQDTLQFRAAVPAGGTASFRLLIPFDAISIFDEETLPKALRTPFNRALARTQQEWQRTFAISCITTPESIVDESFDAWLYHAMMATAWHPWAGNVILKCSPNNYEAMWSAHSAIAAYSMDLRGQHDLSRQVFETLLANQGPLPDHVLKLFGDEQVAESEGFSNHPGFLGNIEGYMAIIWSFYHGWIMWAIGQHARLTNDWKWLRQYQDKLVLTCDWIEAQRKRTRRKENGEKVLSYGLLPASNAFDWGFGHMFWSDAHTYRGLKEIAECLKRLRHPRAKEYLAQAEDYRSDIITSVTRSRDASPQVPLDDGTSIPFVPMSVEMRDYFAPDWTYISCGVLNLVWAGVIPPNHEFVEQVLAFLEAGRPLGKWDEQKQKYQGWDWGAQLPADEDFLECTRPKHGRCYLWRHKMTYEPGWIPQAFTFMMRDDMPALLEHLYSLISNGGQHVDLRTPIEQRDGVAWTQPGDANLLWLVRDMLVREEGNTLVLAGSCPRNWLEDGQSIAITKLPTHFGPVSYRLERKRKDITGVFKFTFHTNPQTIRLRLRHPEGVLPKRVKVDNKIITAEGEWIYLPISARTIKVRY